MTSPHPHAVAVKYLKKVDPKLATVIHQVGPCELRRQGGTYALLARSILSQQISVAAARTIRRRLQSLMPNGRLSAREIAKLSESQLGAVGVSTQKRTYLGDLTNKVIAGQINFRRLAQLPDEDVIAELTEVKGIGVWTAQMFLMFGLGRPDIFAPDDLGLKNAVKALDGVKDPSRQQLETRAKVWAPYRSVAAWYLWRSLDI